MNRPVKGIIGTKKGTGVYVDYTELLDATNSSIASAPEINDKAVKKHAKDWVKGVTDLTPVRSGRARAGWYKGYTGLGMSWTDKGNDPAMQSKGKREGRFVDKTYQKFNKYVIIENKVPYIDKLEMGSGYSSPAGMLRVASLGIQGKLAKSMVKGYKQAWVKKRAGIKRRRR